jgi:hypothetical protein
MRIFSMMSIKKTYSLIIFFGIWGSNMHAMNLLRPYDTLIRPDFVGDRPWQVAFYAEGGLGTKAFCFNGEVCDALRIWQQDQNALKMLQGFPEDSPITQLRNQIDADDDGRRGHFLVRSDFELKYSLALAARVEFLRDFTFAAYLPFYSMELKNVCWQDQTANITSEDMRVKQLLTDNFFALVEELGCGLDLRGWKRSGIGDLTLMLEWFRNFPQAKPLLKNVFLNWRLGLALPTGKRADENKLFAIPFGNDGATSLIFGFGIELLFSCYFKTGVDVQLFHLFDTTRLRRIKTDRNQTELLLLQKSEVHTDFGLWQRFNLFFEFYRFYHGLSFKVGYQFFKKGENHISLACNDFSTNIASTAVSLEDITMHEMILKATYDFGVDRSPDACTRPYLLLYTRLPFNGKHAVLARTLGVVLAVDF